MSLTTLCDPVKYIYVFLISSFRRVLHVVWFILGNYPASGFYMQVDMKMPMKMEQTEFSETSTYKIQTPGNYPKESIQYIYVNCLTILTINTTSFPNTICAPL